MSLRLSTGLRNALAAKYGLPHAALIGTNGAFVDGGGGNDSITDSGNSLITAGFEVGDWVKVFGANTANNNLSAKLLAVASGAMEFATGLVDTAEAFLAGTAVIAAKGGSLNDLFKFGVMHIFSGTQPASADDTESGSTKRIEITDDGNTHVPSTGQYGLQFEDTPSSGVLAKATAQTWKGAALSDGTIGWFRFYDQSVTVGASSTAIRFDGSVALSGAQLNVASINVVNGVDFVINSFNLIVPAS